MSEKERERTRLLLSDKLLLPPDINDDVTQTTLKWRAQIKLFLLKVLVSWMDRRFSCRIWLIVWLILSKFLSQNDDGYLERKKCE